MFIFIAFGILVVVFLFTEPGLVGLAALFGGIVVAPLPTAIIIAAIVIIAAAAKSEKSEPTQKRSMPQTHKKVWAIVGVVLGLYIVFGVVAVIIANQ